MEPIQVVTISVAEIEAMLERIIDRKLSKIKIPTPPKPNRKWTLEEVAKELHLEESTIYTMTSKRTIPHKEGGHLVFFEDEINAWNDKRRKRIKIIGDYE